jgi:pimeloyl-ACP methyl ester carboxylesterase
MKAIQYILVCTLILVIVSCNKRLDSFLFNGDDSIEAYLLDDYPGEVSVELGTDYFVPSSMIHQFEYSIFSEGEGLSISAIYTGDTASISTDTVILYCHGNREHMDFYWPRQRIYSNLGGLGRFGVLMFDYPGYGLSDGTPTEENMYDAANGALRWLKEKGLTNDRLIVYGFSLGSAPTSKIAAGGFEMEPDKIILEAPFASSEVMIQDGAVLAMPGSFLVSLKIDNAEQVKETDAPLLWLHGVNDDFLSMESHGEVVFKNHAGAYKEAERVAGGGHETVPTFMGLENYSERILNFITESN